MEAVEGVVLLSKLMMAGSAWGGCGLFWNGDGRMMGSGN